MNTAIRLLFRFRAVAEAGLLLEGHQAFSLWGTAARVLRAPQFRNEFDQIQQNSNVIVPESIYNIVMIINWELRSLNIANANIIRGQTRLLRHLWAVARAEFWYNNKLAKPF